MLYAFGRGRNMDKKFVEVILTEQTVAMSCSSGCQRATGAPTGG